MLLWTGQACAALSQHSDHSSNTPLCSLWSPLLHSSRRTLKRGPPSLSTSLITGYSHITGCDGFGVCWWEAGHVSPSLNAGTPTMMYLRGLFQPSGGSIQGQAVLFYDTCCSCSGKTTQTPPKTGTLVDLFLVLIQISHYKNIYSEMFKNAGCFSFKMFSRSH